MRIVLLLAGVVLAGCVSSERPLQLIEGAGATYPVEARSQGIEGFVIVQYDVAETGRVTNLSVLEAEPPGVFDEAALKAVAAWKYSPRQVDGQPQPVRGLTSRLEFRLGGGETYRDL